MLITIAKDHLGPFIHIMLGEQSDICLENYGVVEADISVALLSLTPDKLRVKLTRVNDEAKHAAELALPNFGVKASFTNVTPVIKQIFTGATYDKA